MIHINILNGLQIVVAAGGAAGVIWKVGKAIYDKCQSRYNAAVDMQKKIDKIFSEVTPNGGGSIKDKVNKITVALEENTIITQRILSRQTWNWNRLREDDIIFEANDNGEVVWVNRKMADTFKHEVEYFLKHGWRNIVFIEDRERVYTEWDRAVSDKRTFEMGFRITTHDGNIMKINCTATKLTGGYMGLIELKS